jgi:hypothetical protein
MKGCRSDMAKIFWLRARRRGILVFASLAVSLGVASNAVAAGGKGQDEGFDLFFDAAPHVFVQTAKGASSTSFGLVSDAENVSSVMTFRLGGGVRGPAIEALPGRPRPVVWGAVLVPLNESSVIGTEFVEVNSPGNERIEFSKYAIEYETSGLAGIGFEYLVSVFDFELSVTPGLEILFVEGRYTGSSSLDLQQSAVSSSFAISDKKDFSQKLIGPSLRVATRAGTIFGANVNFWIDANASFDVSGSRREIFMSNTEGDTALFSFETGETAFQIGSGLAIRWP